MTSTETAGVCTTAMLEKMKRITLSSVRATLAGDYEILLKYSARNIEIDTPFSKGSLQEFCRACTLEKKLQYSVRLSSYHGSFLKGTPPIYQYRGHGIASIRSMNAEKDFHTTIDVSATWISYMNQHCRMTHFAYACCMPDSESDQFNALRSTCDPTLYFVDLQGMEINVDTRHVIDIRWHDEIVSVDCIDGTLHCSIKCLKTILDVLPECFVQTAACRVLNLRYVVSYRKGFLLLSNGDEWSIDPSWHGRLMKICPDLFEKEKYSDAPESAWCANI